MTKTPKRLWFRTLDSGKVSVAEYLSNRRYNIVRPFKPDDIDKLNLMCQLIKQFQTRTNRKLVAVCDGTVTERVAKSLKLEIT